MSVLYVHSHFGATEPLFTVPAVYSIFSRKLIGKHQRDERINAISMSGA